MLCCGLGGLIGYAQEFGFDLFGVITHLIDQGCPLIVSKSDPVAASGASDALLCDHLAEHLRALLSAARTFHLNAEVGV